MRALTAFIVATILARSSSCFRIPAAKLRSRQSDLAYFKLVGYDSRGSDFYPAYSLAIPQNGVPVTITNPLVVYYVGVTDSSGAYDFSFTPNCYFVGAEGYVAHIGPGQDLDGPQAVIQVTCYSDSAEHSVSIPPLPTITSSSTIFPTGSGTGTLPSYPTGTWYRPRNFNPALNPRDAALKPKHGLYARGSVTGTAPLTTGTGTVYSTGIPPTYTSMTWNRPRNFKPLLNPRHIPLATGTAPLSTGTSVGTGTAPPYPTATWYRPRNFNPLIKPRQVSAPTGTLPLSTGTGTGTGVLPPSPTAIWYRPRNFKPLIKPRHQKAPATSGTGTVPLTTGTGTGTGTVPSYPTATWYRPRNFKPLIKPRHHTAPGTATTPLPTATGTGTSYGTGTASHPTATYLKARHGLPYLR